MQALEVFFDYACPYCLRGHGYLEAVLPGFPGVAVRWQPCEAHPRPDRYGPHSDLCIQGMFFAQAQGVDLWAYHRLVYDLIHRGHVDIESIDALTQALSPLLDADALARALREGAYREALTQANRHAYAESGVWAVPAYRLNDLRLDSVEDVGVSQAQLQAFLESTTKEEGTAP